MMGRNHKSVDQLRKEKSISLGIDRSPRILTEQHKTNISKAMKGRVLTDEWKRKISEANKLEAIGKPNQRPAVKKVRIGRYWYCPGWKTLRKKVWERDGYVCQGCHGRKGEEVPDVAAHHIDCNRENNSMDNLITLCRRCHQKVHKGSLTLDM